MTKLRIKVEVTHEYEANPAHYPEGHRTPETMVAWDLASAKEDPFFILDAAKTPWVVTGEVVQP